jgi:regulator of protease activity HflC (stomatin/prohibitin superfamily)
VTTTESPPTTGRSAALAASRQAKLDALFKDKFYTILKEVHLPEGKVFQTPLGNKGSNGYALQLIDADGNPITESYDDQPTKFMVGATLLRLVAATYGSVQVPPKIRKRRTPEQKASDDARAAHERELAKEARVTAKAEAAAAKVLAREQRIQDKNAKAAKAAARAAARAELVDPAS